jgi:adenylate kinase family enzyme
VRGDRFITARPLATGRSAAQPEGECSLRRVAIVGSPGSGKSTLAVRLGAVTGLPVHHLDQLYWRPGWVETPRSEWVAVQSALVEQPAWIIDGNYGATLPIRLEPADTVVFLDFPRVLCLSRAVRRIVRWHGRVRPDLPHGCPERWDAEFLAFIWGFPRSERPRLLCRLTDAAARGTTVVTLTTPRMADAWLATLLPDRQGR